MRGSIAFRGQVHGRTTAPVRTVPRPLLKTAARRRLQHGCQAVADIARSEKFIQELQELGLEESDDTQEALTQTQRRLHELDREIDEQYMSYFKVDGLQLPDGSTTDITGMTQAEFQRMAREQPEVAKVLMTALEERDRPAWEAFQRAMHGLKLRRSELSSRIETLQACINAAAAVPAMELQADVEEEGAAELAARFLERGKRTSAVNVVLITGFESFNQMLYKKAAQQIRQRFPALQLKVFSDRDLMEASDCERVEAALADADVFFASLLVDFDQVEWLKARIGHIPIRLAFESALELMSETQLGSFQMASPSGEKAGPPPAVKKVLSLFGSGKEEDRLLGYLSFLKIGPKLLKFIPGQKAKDLRNWLTVYAYWNEGGIKNISNMLLHLCNQYFTDTGIQPAEVTTTPQTGCLHPDHDGFFPDAASYMAWYRLNGPLRGTDAPVVSVLLYRKHVITNQPYIPQLVQQMEACGVIPVPIFINGVEAHTIVRDQLTTPDEQARIRQGGARPSGLSSAAVPVDAIISTIGFPLVGGPAGTMEGGRQAEIAKAILSSKNVPYFVAAPLLIQDLESWSRDGVAGLQSVVLYSLPELDGAIDTVPLGGLIRGNIYLIPERIMRLSNRIKNWVSLRKKPPAERKVAVCLYGFPPGVGSTGTAALLNVPASIENLLRALREQGYDLGDLPEDVSGLGEAIVSTLKRLEQSAVVMRGEAGVAAAGAGAAGEWGAHAVGVEVSPRRLRELLTFDESWGPTEWGPIPFLPRSDLLVSRMEKQWGSLDSYRGINSTGAGNLLVAGVQVGNVWFGTQPALGIEGDPMRLLFDRDLTPHPQYAAFYKFLEHDLQADAVVHFGMHGTVEWLPGQPLGNSGLSWSDVLISNLPNVYIYAANNPSESIIAKRRGYGTIISHNVPPYGRAGLYKQLAELRGLLQEFRENPDKSDDLREPIVECLLISGLEKDCPFRPATPSSAAVYLETSTVNEVDAAEFKAYVVRLYRYLQEVENRLFSEGLHVLGQAPEAAALEAYLNAYLDGSLPDDAVSVLASTPESSGGSAQIQRLKSLYSHNLSAPGAGEGGEEKDIVEDAWNVRCLLAENVQELSSLVRALNGEYVLPEAGGDLLRDGPGVLPTGRNIHALDPYRMPSAAADKRGAEAGAAIIASHRAANNGAYPETVAVNLWGLDAIKTKGESVGLALYLVGARPLKEKTGRIARFELIPLEELGRPRIDVLCNMSGIFRDSFQNVVELLDDMFRRAAAADEPAEMNFVKKHAEELAADKVANPSARLFSNPAGDYGSMVNERVGASNWNSADELGDTWASRNAFSYGRGAERGTARPEVLRKLLSTSERIVQQIDSVEYGLTDIQEYYANTGALKAAAQAAQGGKPVGVSIVEAFSKDVKPRELEDVLRLEYRSKLLNPKWAQAMAAQGSGGAFEIGQRMTAMLGWGATVDFKEDWTWQQAAETYVMDEQMAATLRKNNPEAFRNTVKRMIEAIGRGMWNADDKTLKMLQDMYSDIDDELENVQ